MTSSLRSARAPRGYALVTALIFLTVLTLIAVTALRGTTLELRMAGNTVKRTEAFEASEGVRLIASDLIEPHVFTRGWPSTMSPAPPADFSVPPAIFDYTIPTGLTVIGAENLFEGNEEAAFHLWDIDAATAGNQHFTTDITFERTISLSGVQPLSLASQVAVHKMRTDTNPGAGSQMVAGYEGIGKSAAGGGGRIFFLVQSRGTDSSSTLASPESQYVTGASYRYVIRN